MQRYINESFVNDKDEKVFYQKKENQRRKKWYKKAIGECCMPGCDKTWDLQIHHILPIKNGGTDAFTNYIILCGDCHRTNKLHSKHEEKKLEILVYKFYKEKLILGFCSDDLSAEEFQLRLMKIADKS